MIENIVLKTILTTSLIGLLFMAVIFNTMLPPMLKNIEDKTERALAIAVSVFCDILLLCAIILIVNGLIKSI